MTEGTRRFNESMTNDVTVLSRFTRLFEPLRLGGVSLAGKAEIHRDGVGRL